MAILKTTTGVMRCDFDEIRCGGDCSAFHLGEGGRSVMRNFLDIPILMGR